MSPIHSALVTSSIVWEMRLVEVPYGAWRCAIMNTFYKLVKLHNQNLFFNLLKLIKGMPCILARFIYSNVFVSTIILVRSDLVNGIRVVGFIFPNHTVVAD
jgi:hypothetical protein